ncbi:uncharacterized protein K02A2.6-like [Pantherophis guttatus]|uniref:Gypsy retrotransposon integrase-like protein 1 n=1 Tax=Pantherophis guttatus TaxID=94885 RepID=A0ABM3ZHH0_PANGU|nr:uncharacterized protein K02A2.6-like [Pantherophis guttatus]
MSAYTPPAPFDPKEEKWGSYMSRFECFMVANDMQGLPDVRKKALFLSHCGPRVFDTAEALSEPNSVHNISWSTLQTLLKDHYAPTPSKYVQRYDFRQRLQQEGESISEYIAALCKAATQCEYRDLDEMLLEQLIFGVRDSRLQRRLLARSNLTLLIALDEARAQESSTKAAERLKSSHVTRTTQKTAPVHREATSTTSEGESEEEVYRTEQSCTARREPRYGCASCGGSHSRQNCKFRDAICRSCEKRGHIARVCRSKAHQSYKPRGQPFQSEPAPHRRPNRDGGNQKGAKFEDAGAYTIRIAETCTSPGEKTYTTVEIEGRECQMEIDTGSPISIMSWENLKKIIPSARKRQLQPQQRRLKDYQGNRIPVEGRGEFQVQYGEFTEKLPLTIVSDNLPSLLGMDWFRALGMGFTGVRNVRSTLKEDLMQEFQDVFDERLGKYVGTPISFNLNPNIAPIRLKPRRVPFALKPKIDIELDKLIKQGVLVPVDHANWETPIVTPVKPDGSVRICADYKCTINKALQQSAYPVPIVHHLLHSLGPGKIFAKLDLAQAYQQLPVDGATAEAQTIVTHRGAFKCNRLQFGVSVAPGLFQSTMERLLQGIPRVVPYFDDVLITADNEQQLRERLRGVLRKFRDAGLRVKRNKCMIAVPSVEFLGYRVDGTGIHPTESKIRAIREAPTPKDKAELQAFLGLLNFYAIFLKDKATVAEPLHRLLTKKATWKWGKAEDRAFAGIKKLLSAESFLIQYNATLPLVLACDASPFGVGAVLSHRLPNGLEAPIAYYSRTLSSAERNYSQLDKEALAAVSGVKKFHEYLFGRDFELITNHRPLLGLLAGDRPTPAALSPRMTRWAIFLAAYSYRLVHRPGADMGNADALSRCPLPDGLEDPTPGIPILLIDVLDSGPITSAEVARASTKDHVIRTVASWVMRGWPEKIGSGEFKLFAGKRDELTMQGGCLLWGDRVVIPLRLREKVLTLLHEGHPGIVRMKGLARSYVWWPSMDTDITEWVGRCQPCQESRSDPPTAPVREWERPQGPWSRIHIDFAGPFHRQTFMVVVDAFSKWLEIKLMKATTTDATIRELRQLFATHGLPDILVSDNGPQFTATQFEGYLAGLGIRHVLSAPFHPASNGQAERFVRSAKEALSRLSPGDWQERIDKFLIAQHSTPCTATGRNPAELLMGRKLRGILDRLNPNYSPEVFKGGGEKA